MGLGRFFSSKPSVNSRIMNNGPFLWIRFNCLKDAEPLLGDSLLFITKSPRVPGTHFTNFGGTKD